jgi:hypothetical protein
LSKIAGELLLRNEFEVQEKLNDMYNDTGWLWQVFYKSYNRFKTAFDAERNRIYHIKKYGSEPSLEYEQSDASIISQRELTEEEKRQVFHRDQFKCQCCGKAKEKGRKVRLEVDHIVPFKFGGETSIGNSQTLCSSCNQSKSVNEINFKVHKTPLLAPKENLTLCEYKESETYEEVIKRMVNIFYHCNAVAEVKWDWRPRSKYRYDWEVVLYEGNNPKWLENHIDSLKRYIIDDLKNTDMKNLRVR